MNATVLDESMLEERPTGPSDRGIAAEFPLDGEVLLLRESGLRGPSGPDAPNVVYAVG
jgi:hypothetical protein